MREGSVGGAVLLGEYILETGATVRAAAKVFKISKSTVHKDITEKLFKTCYICFFISSVNSRSYCTLLGYCKPIATSYPFL